MRRQPAPTMRQGRMLAVSAWTVRGRALWLLVLLSMVGALACRASWANTQTLRIATGELPPYATQARADQGIALDIVRRAFALAGYQVQFHFLPWARAQQETRQGLFGASAYW